MTISKSLTWQFDTNNSIAQQASAPLEGQMLWRQWKNALKGFAAFPFTVAGSSNGSAAAMDGVDRWAADTDLVVVNSTGAHGWIVLECPVTGLQILVSGIVATAAAFHAVRFKVSPGGLYTGGNTTTDPTATDEITILNGLSGHSFGRPNTNTAANTLGDRVFHVLRDEDGLVTMWMVCSTSGCKAFGYIGKIENATDDDIIVASLFANTGSTDAVNALVFSNLFDELNTTVQRCYFGSLPVVGNASCWLTAPTVSIGGAVATRTATNETAHTHTASNNQILGQSEHAAIGCYCSTTGARGTHGKLYDVRWAGDDHASGSTYPLDGSRAWVKMGPLLVPWDGSVPVIA